MNFKTIFSVISILLLNFSVCGQNDRVTLEEFQQVVGKWTGKLTYLDYQSNQPYEMKANLEIIQLNNSAKFQFINSYPNEPSANSIDTVAINDSGKMIDKKVIKSKRKLLNGNLEVVTEILGNDGNDNKPALMKYTYLIGKSAFEIKKEVQFSESKIWILRHTYTYSRD